MRPKTSSAFTLQSCMPRARTVLHDQGKDYSVPGRCSHVADGQAADAWALWTCAHHDQESSS